MAELAVLITSGIGLPVFEPQKPQGHSLAGKFPVDVLHGMESGGFPMSPFFRNKKESLQIGVIEIGRKRPGQSRLLRPFQVRIPVKTATHSGAKRPPVPTQKSHPFRFKSAALSERSDAGFQSSFS
jgi:hypothetical protein